MLNNSTFYHGSIRKIIVGFGNLFSNVYIDRKQGNSVTGTTIQRLQIPLSYSNKEKWVQRLDGDPTLENNVAVSLPRMAFEITGYNYDSSRKVSKMQRVCKSSGAGTNAVDTVYSPVPYNLDISLYILTKTQEDGLQILEQILPTFTPEYTLAINSLPGMGIVQDTPIVLNSVSVDDSFDGDFITSRFVTHTLSFTAKLNLFGGVSTNNNITTTVIANVGEDTSFTADPLTEFQAVGDADTETITSSNWTDNF